jgi:PHP family Zn ribbon phosphoesterase
VKKTGGSWHKGQCQKCKVAYNWTGGPRLQDAKCPKCGGRLSWVSWDDNAPWEVLSK